MNLVQRLHRALYRRVRHFYGANLRFETERLCVLAGRTASWCWWLDLRPHAYGTHTRRLDIGLGVIWVSVSTHPPPASGWPPGSP